MAVQRLALVVACDRLLVRHLGRLGFAGWPAACFLQRRLGPVNLAARVHLGVVSLHQKFWNANSVVADLVRRRQDCEKDYSMIGPEAPWMAARTSSLPLRVPTMQPEAA